VYPVIIVLSENFGEFEKGLAGSANDLKMPLVTSSEALL
jgi:hypothetical protein